MSDQQPIRYTNFYGGSVNGRPTDAHNMAMPFYAPQRLDHMSVSLTPNSQQPVYVRNVNQMPRFYGPLAQSQLYCPYPSGLADVPPNNFSEPHNDYPHHLPYPCTMYVMNSPIQSQSNSQQVSTQATTTAFSREKRPLPVFDPRTMSQVDLAIASGVKLQNQNSQPEPLCIENSEPESTAAATTENAVEEQLDVDKDVIIEEASVKDTVSDDGAAYLAEDKLDICDDIDECSESEPEEAPGRRRYSREFILSCKNSSSLIDLKHYQVLMNQIYAQQRLQNRSRGYYGRQRVIHLPAKIAVKRIEGAFVPTKLRAKEACENEDNMTHFTRDINLILNRVSENNFQDTIEEIKKLNVSNAETMIMLATTMFEKAISQTKFVKVYASMCKHFKGFEVPGSERFSVLLVQLTQNLFEKPLEVLLVEENKKVDARMMAAKDDSVKRMIDEDRETNIAKQTDAYYGNMVFIAELYLCGVITMRTMTSCLKRLKESDAPEAVPSMLIFLNICGRELDLYAKSHLDACIARLKQLRDNHSLESPQVYKLQEIIELRARGWKPVDVSLPPSNAADIAPRRMADDKQRRGVLTNDTRRKSVQSTNPLKPSTLAVTQRSYDSRKLGPTVDNWFQGSGQLLKTSEDNHTKLNQVNLLNRSREASPYVPSGPQGAWANPLPGTLGAKKRQNDYSSALETTKSRARTIVEMVGVDSCEDVFEHCEEFDRPALLHNTYEILMDKNSKMRYETSQLIVDFLDKMLLKPEDLICSFAHFFETCDDDWIDDYPRGWLYISEILQHLLVSGHSSLLLKIVDPLRSDKHAAQLIAYCIELNVKVLGEEKLTDLLDKVDLDWSELGISTTDLKDFLDKHSIGFLLNKVDTNTNKLKQLQALLRNPETTDEEVCKAFTLLSSQKLTEDFVRSLMSILLHSDDYSQSKADSFANPLRTLVDHDPERELYVLYGLQNATSDKALVESWLVSLIGRKVISSDALAQWKCQKKSESSTRMRDILYNNPVLRDFMGCHLPKYS